MTSREKQVSSAGAAADGRAPASRRARRCHRRCGVPSPPPAGRGRRRTRRHPVGRMVADQQHRGSLRAADLLVCPAVHALPWICQRETISGDGGRGQRRAEARMPERLRKAFPDAPRSRLRPRRVPRAARSGDRPLRRRPGLTMLPGNPSDTCTALPAPPLLELIKSARASARSRRCAASPSLSRPARWWRSSATTAPESRRWSRSSPATAADRRAHRLRRRRALLRLAGRRQGGRDRDGLPGPLALHQPRRGSELLHGPRAHPPGPRHPHPRDRAMEAETRRALEAGGTRIPRSAPASSTSPAANARPSSSTASSTGAASSSSSTSPSPPSASSRPAAALRRSTACAAGGWASC